MTREEQIRVVAIQYADHESAAFVNYPMQEAVLSFQAGVKWADANPNWHKFPDEKPSKEGNYIVSDGELSYETLWMKGKFTFANEHGYYEDTDITAWMEFPKPPKFD